MALQEEMVSQGNILFKNRSYLPLIILVFGLLVFSQSAKAGILPHSINLYFGACLIVGLIGLWIRVYTVGHAAANTSGRNTAEGQVADEVNMTGIYSTVRHPLYLGNFFMWLAPAMLTYNLWFIVAFVLFYWLYYERIMIAEENFLREKFGNTYLDWSSHTPAFIPKLSQFTKNKYPFDWKKVILKEKNGLAALIVLFYIFDTLRIVIIGQDQTLTRSIWFLPAICLIGIYLILKVIKISKQKK